MRKRTSLRTPKTPKASPNQTSELIAKGQKPGKSVQEECVLLRNKVMLVLRAQGRNPKRWLEF